MSDLKVGDRVKTNVGERRGKIADINYVVNFGETSIDVFSKSQLTKLEDKNDATEDDKSRFIQEVQNEIVGREEELSNALDKIEWLKIHLGLSGLARELPNRFGDAEASRLGFIGAIEREMEKP